MRLRSPSTEGQNEDESPPSTEDAGQRHDQALAALAAPHDGAGVLMNEGAAQVPATTIVNEKAKAEEKTRKKRDVAIQKEKAEAAKQGTIVRR